MVTINGTPAKASEGVRLGDHITAQAPPPAAVPESVTPENIPLEILYEDDALLCLNKPPGLVVHPAVGHWKGTMVNAILHYCKGVSTGGHPMRPGIVHRLDKDTSGCIL